MKRVEEILDSLSGLPPTPTIFARLLELLKDPLVDAAKLVSLIEMDEAITANVLRVCNSAAYAGHSRVRNVKEAVTRLGNENILRIAMATASQGVLSGTHPGYDMGPGDLWKHGIGVGVACRSLAPRLGIQDPFTAFTAGLLHDIGKLVLSRYVAEAYKEIRLLVVEKGMSFCAAENEALGLDHAELGGKLAERWNFPSSLVDVIRWHHHPEMAEAEPRMATLVYFGDLLAHMTGPPVGMDVLAEHIRREMLRDAGLTYGDVEEALLVFAEDLEVSSESLGISLTK
jgi:putative nucleotidyltransferase with HDIG domain